MKPYDTDMKILDTSVVERLAEMGVTDLERVYNQDDMARSDELLFLATGVTRGDVLAGVKKNPEGFETESLIIHSQSTTIQQVLTRKSLDFLL